MSRDDYIDWYMQNYGCPPPQYLLEKYFSKTETDGKNSGKSLETKEATMDFIFGLAIGLLIGAAVGLVVGGMLNAACEGEEAAGEQESSFEGQENWP